VFLIQSCTRSLDSANSWAGSLTSSVVAFVAATLLVAFLALYFVRWVCTLKPPVRTLIIAAGTLFCGGAIAMEAVTEWWWVTYGSASLPYVFGGLVEESLEAAGLIVFIQALLIELSSRTLGAQRVTDPR
jgi:hypothetical protein